MNAAIVILTQNTVERKIYLKTSLYFLFKNFNKNYKYPIIILHEGDYDDDAKKEIILGIRSDYRYLLSFCEIDKDDFTIPNNIDLERVSKIVSLKPVPYWRNLKYRMMCNFWMNHIYKYTKDYEYFMRLDDDSIIEEPICLDLFKHMYEKQLIYVSNFVHIDCGLCNYGMKDLFKTIFPDSKEIDKLFISSKLPMKTDVFEKFNQILQLNKLEPSQTDINTDMPIMYYNNFFITKTDFWQRNDVKNVIQKINDHGGIFYYRYGDAPLQTLIVSLLNPQGISRTSFKYSKRLQREVFKYGNEMHSYMPKNYDDTSCIIKDKK